MSATFKCNKTGNTVTFKNQYDIDAMREHPEYTEVEVLTSQEQKHTNSGVTNGVLTSEEQPLKRGRPKKEQA